MPSQDMEELLAAFIARTSSVIPKDALAALERARNAEEPGSGARIVLDTIIENTALAAANGTPMCQDTGTLTFFASEDLRAEIPPKTFVAAVRLATAHGALRHNTIDSITGRSHDDNTCPGAPVVHYVPAPPGTVRLLMKGGGSENMSRQFSLPDSSIGAGRDMAGVERAILEAVHQAQGYGCAPGILGVCIGGDRATGFDTAKEQLLRDLSDENPIPSLAALERSCLEKANSLGIGPMGLGGKTTLLAVKIAALPRVPASFFVTVAYLCWAARRGTLDVNTGEMS